MAKMPDQRMCEIYGKISLPLSMPQVNQFGFNLHCHKSLERQKSIHNLMIELISGIDEANNEREGLTKRDATESNNAVIKN